MSEIVAKQGSNQDDVNFPVKLRNNRAWPSITSRWASPRQWRRQGWTYINPCSLTTWRTSSLLFLRDLKRSIERAAPGNQLKARHTTWPQSQRQPTNRQLLTKLLRRRKANLIVCPVSRTSKLWVSPQPPPPFFLNRTPPRDRVGEGRLLA